MSYTQLVKQWDKEYKQRIAAEKAERAARQEKEGLLRASLFVQSFREESAKIQQAQEQTTQTIEQRTAFLRSLQPKVSYPVWICADC